jgi:hypothetical protein
MRFIINFKLTPIPPTATVCKKPTLVRVGGGGFIYLVHGVPKIVGEPAPTNSLWQDCAGSRPHPTDLRF